MVNFVKESSFPIRYIYGTTSNIRRIVYTSFNCEIPVHFKFEECTFSFFLTIHMQNWMHLKFEDVFILEVIRSVNMHVINEN
jgi:hypothetical protein